MLKLLRAPSTLACTRSTSALALLYTPTPYLASSTIPTTTPPTATTPQPSFLFSEENFRKPQLPTGLEVVDVPLVVATDESLKGFGRILHSPDDALVEDGA